MVKIAAIGDNCIDVYTNLNRAFPGGGPVNFAVHARRSGAATAYIGVVGQDANGDWLKQALIDEEVDVRHLSQVPGPTAIAYVRLEGADRVFIPGGHRGVRTQLRVTPEIDAYLNGFDLIHTTLDGCVDEMIPTWHSQGLRISYDFSHRPLPAQLDLIPYLYVAFFSGQKMSPHDAPAATAAYYVSGGPVIVMTLGATGSLAYDGQRYYEQSALSTPLVDTLGAGDAFQAAFMVEYLHSGLLPAALAAGAQCAAAACTALGGFGHGRVMA